jgi:transcriptional regulator with XRE-family HTH domain
MDLTHRLLFELRRRYKAGETLRGIADAAGVQQPMLSRFLSGDRDLRLSTAAKLAKYLRLELTPRKGAKSRR